jgi:hypothetical protein
MQNPEVRYTYAPKKRKGQSKNWPKRVKGGLSRARKSLCASASATSAMTSSHAESFAELHVLNEISVLCAITYGERLAWSLG